MRVKSEREMSVQQIVDEIENSIRKVSSNISSHNGHYNYNERYYKPESLFIDVVTNGFNLHSSENDHLMFDRKSLRDLVSDDGVQIGSGRFGEFFEDDDRTNYHNFVIHIDKYDPTVLQHKDDPDGVVIGTIFLSSTAPETRAEGLKAAEARSFASKLKSMNGQLIKDEKEAEDIFNKAKESFEDPKMKIDIMHVSTDHFEFKSFKNQKRMFDKNEYSFGSLKVGMSDENPKFILYVKMLKTNKQFENKNKFELYLNQNKRLWNNADIDIFKDKKMVRNDYMGYDSVAEVEDEFKAKFERGVVYHKDDKITHIRIYLK